MICFNMIPKSTFIFYLVITKFTFNNFAKIIA